MQTYGPPPRTSPWPVLGRVVLALVVSAASTAAALVAAFAAGVLWSGCFIGCSGERDPLAGLGLSLLAGALLAAGPLLTGWLFRSRAWVLAAGWLGAAGTLVCALWASSA